MKSPLCMAAGGVMDLAVKLSRAPLSAGLDVLAKKVMAAKLELVQHKNNVHESSIRAEYDFFMNPSTSDAL